MQCEHEDYYGAEHLDAIEARVKEAAADLQMDEDIVWHDVAVGYLESEVDDPAMQGQLCRSLGIDPVVLGPWKPWTEVTGRNLL